MSGKPATPAELRDHASPIPGVVFDVFNALLAKGAGIREVVIKQETVVAHLKERGYKSSELFDNRWLDVEASYEAAGWTVVYDKPGHNESYEAFWRFAPKAAKP